MNHTRTLRLAVLALLLGGAVGFPSRVAAQGFDSLVAGLGGRPAVLLETDYYIYGPGTGFDVPDVNLTLDSVNTGPATLYLYWQDRVSGETLYYNIHQGFVDQEVDLLGTNGPVKLNVPDLEGFQLFGPSGALGPLPAVIPAISGHYQMILEVRDADGVGVLGRGNAMYNFVDGVVEKSGQITASETWTSNNAYLLATPVQVGRNPDDPGDATPLGVTLTIEPGTVVLGSQAGQGTLVVFPDGRLKAAGTATLPIIFGSELPVGQRAPGNWGGLVISGRAPTNQIDPVGEGDSGTYGGNDPDHSSGTLRYARVEFAGIRFSEQNELNGIALQGVGRGTAIDHVQVHFNQDDGIEFFGGTADAKYVLITDARDDSLDWTFGWNGRVQHFVAIQRHNQADNGIEADNFRENPTLEPRSAPAIYNGTWVGNAPIAVADPSADVGNGWLLRRGTLATLRNTLVQSFFELGVVVDGDESKAEVGLGLTIENSILFNNNEGLTDDQAVADYLMDAAQDNLFVNPLLPNPNSLVQPDIAPLPGSVARVAANVEAPPNDGFFDTDVTWIGGVDPATPWIYEGWTTFSEN